MFWKVAISEHAQGICIKIFFSVKIRKLKIKINKKNILARKYDRRLK